MLRARLIDCLSRKESWARYQEYSKSQWYDREALDQFRVHKLRRLLEHCERHVPFYRDALRRAGVRPQDVTSLDCLGVLPVVDKSAIKAQYSEFLAVPGSIGSSIHYSQTGGTTGEPLLIPKDAGMRSAAAGARLRFYDWMGIRFGDPVMVLWGAPIVARNWRKLFRTAILELIAHTKQLNTFGITDNSLRDMLAAMQSFQPVLLHGYCQSIYEFARWLIDRDRQFPLRAVSTTVEPLFDYYRPVFKQAFGCEAFDEYGCGEVETIAMECDAHRGRHVVEERVILELDESGNVIVTDLDNFALPFIRYRNGDQAVPAGRPCSCGRVHTLLARISGRVGDVIAGPNGKRVHPEFFTHLLNETGIAPRARLRKYQVVQESPGNLRWTVVADPLTDADEQWLKSKVREYLGDMSVSIERADDIPLARSGKFQYVIVRR